MRLVIPAGEVKNSQALDFLLPEATTARIKRYIAEWRTLFLPKANPYLFPGRAGNRLVHLRWQSAVRGKAMVKVRCDNPL